MDTARKISDLLRFSEGRYGIRIGREIQHAIIVRGHGGKMSDGASIRLTIAITAVGSAASWLISRWYYRQSGSDLDAALQPLAGDSQKQLQGLAAIGRMLEQAGIGKPTFDAA